MTKPRITAANLKHISTLVDEIALEKPLDWEAFNYESVKEVAIQGVLETYLEVVNNNELTEEERGISVLATMAYLVMENTHLHILLLKQKLN